MSKITLPKRKSNAAKVLKAFDDFIKKVGQENIIKNNTWLIK